MMQHGRQTSRQQCRIPKGMAKNEIKLEFFRLEQTNIYQMRFCAHKFKTGVHLVVPFFPTRNIQNKILDPANKKCKKNKKRNEFI